MIGTVLMFAMFGLGHKKEAPKVKPHTEITIYVSHAQTELISSDLVLIDDAEGKCPWLKAWTSPARDRALVLLQENGNESEYFEDLQDLQTDVWFIAQMQKNATI